ncbi:hypothetical protein [Parapedobacter koreensis]|uniref:Uncharacterized protein n=1 Tax=Parapedobacter koreensis TaxID=332977 RepID=A0A1H7MHI1_9SPHI|nr:hypothetical protein [Parapedobacter koreensis]SEL10551.1 hypothetical protein SAMN05421740_103515 [Parapedobacter koreensis]
MKRLRLFAIFLLIFNGLSAIAGGGILIIDPQGYAIRIPVSILQYSPFSNFLIPGILLFIFNGLSSLLIAWAVINRIQGYLWLVIFQGVASITWIVTQVVMIREIVLLHYIYGGIGLLFLVAGILLERYAD